MKSKFLFIFSVISFVTITFTACDGEEAVAGGEAGNPIIEEVDTINSDTDTALTLPIQQTATGYEPIRQAIPKDVFTRCLFGGYWTRSEHRYVFEDGSMSEQIFWSGLPTRLFTLASDSALMISYIPNGPGPDWKENLEEYSFMYDELSNFFTFGNGKSTMAYTVLSITEDEMRCTAAPDEILISDYHVQPHVLQYEVFKHYKTEEEFRRAIH